MEILDKIPEWLNTLLGFLGIGLGTGGGILFYKSKRLKSDSEGRESKAHADLEEAKVYKSRIKSLGEEVEVLESKVKSLREQLDEMTNQRDTLMSLCGTQELTIEELNHLIEKRKQENIQLKKENAALKGSVTKLTKKVEALVEKQS